MTGSEDLDTRWVSASWQEFLHPEKEGQQEASVARPVRCLFPQHPGWRGGL